MLRETQHRSMVRAALDTALALLSTARAPMMMVESGVARADALDEVVRFAELIGAAVYQSWMADVNFPVDHPLYMGDLDPGSLRAGELLEEADVLIGVGCSMFAEGFLLPEAAVPSHVKVIHIDDDPWELGKNLPTDCPIQADIKAGLTELNELLARELPPEARERAGQRIARPAEEKKRAGEKEADEGIGAEAGLRARMTAAEDEIPISIPRLMNEIKRTIDPGTVIVDECWSASGTLRKTLHLSTPKSYFRSRKGGSIGWGLPGALGVKLGLPGRQVLAVVGDGGAAWSMQSLWTAAHYEIPVTCVITNNATYGQVKLVRAAVLGSYPLQEKHVGMELDSPVLDFAMLARAMGVHARTVSHPRELGDALREAVTAGEPRLVEVLVEKPS